jgi:hypothetical protein
VLPHELEQLGPSGDRDRRVAGGDALDVVDDRLERSRAVSTITLTPAPTSGPTSEIPDRDAPRFMSTSATAGCSRTTAERTPPTSWASGGSASTGSKPWARNADASAWAIATWSSTSTSPRPLAPASLTPSSTPVALPR